jgi:DNA repair exonuclease SbcCD ATPase subunit
MVKKIIIRKDVNIQKIYHISDIHIRLDNARYDEYNKIFKKVRDKINEDSNNSLIVVTGDILHSKTNLKPECVDLVKKFFNRLTSLTDVIVIVGNHDCNINNKESMDSLTPLIDRHFKSDHDIHLLRRNKLYEYGNVIFGVTSIYAESITPCDIETDKIKIALYHGFVAGAKTDLGFSVRKKKNIFDIKDFAEYDYGLFGDVHKFQYLDEDKKIAYSSSLIQQNYSETIENHGMIKWDLENETSEFIQIDNDYGYVTLHIVHGELKDYDEDAMPKISRIKLVYDEYTEEKELSEIEKMLKVKHTIAEFVTNKVFTDKTLEIKLDGEEEMPETMDNELVRKIVRTYMVKHDVELNMRKNLLEKVDELLEDIDVDRKKVIRRVSLESIEFDNLFLYNEKNRVRFKNLNGIVGLIAPNHCGKSCLIDSIMFGIFGECPKGGKRDCININQKKYLVSTELSVNDVKYKIDRIGSVEGKSIKEHLQFYEDESLITKDDKKQTEENISDKICQYNDFIRLNIMLQGDTEFITMTDKKRKDMLYKYFNLNIFGQLIKAVHKKIHQLRYMISIDKKETKDVDIDAIRNQLTEMKSAKKKLTKDKKKTDKTLKDKYYEHSKLKEILGKNNVADVSYENIDEDIKKLEEKLETKNKTLSELKKDTKSSDKEISKIEKSIDEFGDIKKKRDKFLDKNKKDKKKVLDELNVLYSECKTTPEYDRTIYDAKLVKRNNELKQIKVLVHTFNQEISNDIMRINTMSVSKETKKNYMQFIKNKKYICDKEKDLDTNRKELLEMNIKYEKVKNHKFNKECDACMANPLTNEKIELEKMIKSYMQNQEDIENSIKSLTKKNEVLQKYYDEYVVFLDISESNKEINKEIKAKKEMLDTHCEKLDAMKLKVNEVKYKLKEYDEYDKILANNEKINKTIKEKKKIYDALENSKYEDYEIYCKLIDQLNSLKEIKNEKNSKKHIIKEKISKLEVELSDLEEVEKNKDSIGKYQKIGKKIDEMTNRNEKNEKEIKDYQSKIVDFEVKKDRYKQADKKITENQKEMDIYSKLYDLLGKNGLIDNIFINEIIPKLQNHINNILGFISDFTINVVYNKGTIQIYKNVGGKQINLMSTSGYEKFIMNIVFRLAMLDLNSNFKADFFIIDEGFSYCDSENLDKLKVLFEYLRKKFKWSLIVSHLEEVKGNFDKEIQIQILDKESHIFV